MSVCDLCGVREAVAFNTAVVGTRAEHRYLCIECAARLGSTAFKEIASAVNEARCCYCGARPCYGGTDALGPDEQTQVLRFMCEACSLEFLSFLEGQLQSIPVGLSLEEQLIAVQRVQSESIAYMKRKPAQNRKGRD